MEQVILPNSAPAGQGSPKRLENQATALVTFRNWWFFSLCVRWRKPKFFYEREVMKADREVTKALVFHEVTKAVA